MGFLTKFFGAVPWEERHGIHLDTMKPFWEVDGKFDFPTLLRCLRGLLPERSILYFEDGSPDGSLAEFLRAHSVPEHAHLANGTIRPRPAIYHLPATPDVLVRLADEMECRATPELAIHFHVYCDQVVLLEWHDAFFQPMLLSGGLQEQQVKEFCERANLRYAYWKDSEELTAAQIRKFLGKS